MKNCLFYIFLITIVAACSKPGDAEDNNHTGGGGGGGTGVVDTIAPVIEIYSPFANQVFQGGSNISITGKVTDDIGLFRGSIRITNDANGALLKEQLYEIHFILSYNFDLGYIPFVSVPTDCTVTISYEDHGSNITTRTVKIRITP